MRDQWQKVKREHNTRFLKVKEHPLTNGDIYEDWMDIMKILNICNNNKHKDVYRLMDYRQRGWKHNLL
jgi:hypothetical protein